MLHLPVLYTPKQLALSCVAHHICWIGLPMVLWACQRMQVCLWHTMVCQTAEACPHMKVCLRMKACLGKEAYLHTKVWLSSWAALLICCQSHLVCCSTLDPQSLWSVQVVLRSSLSLRTVSHWLPWGKGVQVLGNHSCVNGWHCTPGLAEEASPPWHPIVRLAPDSCMDGQDLVEACMSPHSACKADHMQLQGALDHDQHGDPSPGTGQLPCDNSRAGIRVLFSAVLA